MKHLVRWDIISFVDKKALNTIFLIVLIDLLGFGLILPLLPYIAERYQADAFQIGLLTATYSFFQFIASPILGRLSDRYGRKKLLIFSQIGSVIGYLLLAFGNSLPALFLSRAIDGATGGNISIAQAYIADVTDQKNRAKGMGFIGAAFGIGFAVGPAIGGLLYKIGGFELPALFAAFMGIVTVIATAFFLQETVNVSAAKAGQSAKIDFRQIKKVLAIPSIFLLTLTFFLLSFAFSSLTGSFAIWAEQSLGLGPETIGIAFTYIGVLSIIAQLKLLPMVVKSQGERNTLLISLPFLAIGTFLVPFSVSLLMLFGIMVFVVIGNSLSSPALTAIASENVEKDSYGETLGVMQSAGSLGRIVGPILGGFFFTYFNPHAPYVFAATVVMLAFFFLLKFLPVKASAPANTGH